MRRVGVLVLLAVVFRIGPVTTSATEAPAASTVFQFGSHGEPIVTATLNGVGPYRFIFDTGSSHTSITKGTVQKLGLRPVAKSMVSTSLGREMQAIVEIGRLDLGAWATSGVLASVMPDDEDIHGVIGQDVLASRRYTLDFRHRRVVWHENDDEHPDSAFGLKLKLDEERFIAELPQRSSILRLVPDSGANGLVLFHKRDFALTLSTTSGFTWLSTISDRKAMPVVSVQELRVGRATLRNLPAVIVERADASQVDGLLPLRLFDTVTIDGPGRLLIVNDNQQSQSHVSQ